MLNFNMFFPPPPILFSQIMIMILILFLILFLSLIIFIRKQNKKKMIILMNRMNERWKKVIFFSISISVFFSNKTSIESSPLTPTMTMVIYNVIYIHERKIEKKKNHFIDKKKIWLNKKNIANVNVWETPRLVLYKSWLQPEALSLALECPVHLWWTGWFHPLD